jgi:hypothetical protein
MITKYLCLLLLTTTACFAQPPTTNSITPTEPKGFLVFEIERYLYSTRNGKGEQDGDLKQSFKVPLTPEFMANFKELPGQNSSGTGFYCRAGNSKSDSTGTGFMWWIRRTADHRWAINMWGKGTEAIAGVKLNSANCNVSQNVTIRNWEDLDMNYMLSFFSKDKGLNVSFTAKYLTAQEMKTAGPIPTAPVETADHSIIFKSENPAQSPIQIECGFQ